jgi:hypothetical protein
MSRKVFTSQKLTVFLAGKEFRVQALVSIYGAKYVFDDTDIPEEAKRCLGVEVQAVYKGIPVRCRFVRETNGVGTIYSLRFLSPTKLLLQQIEKDVLVTGLPSPWMRSLPRLTTTAAKHLPVPALAIVQIGRSTIYMSIKNFTLGGLQLEYSGDDARDLKVGTRIEFDIVTNGGDKLVDLAGQITHVTVELNDSIGASGRYQFGMKFLPSNVHVETRYKAMIRAHCEGLKDEFSEGPGV